MNGALSVPGVRVREYKIRGGRLRAVGFKYWQPMKNYRWLKSGGRGYESKLATRSGARAYPAKEYLRETGRDLGPAQGLKRGRNSTGPKANLN